MNIGFSDERSFFVDEDGDICERVSPDPRSYCYKIDGLFRDSRGFVTGFKYVYR